MKKVIWISLFAVFAVSFTKNEIKRVDPSSFSFPTASVNTESSTPFTDIFRSLNPEQLQNSQNEEELNEIIAETNARITEVYLGKYNIDLASEFSEDPFGITVMGLYQAAKERYLIDGHELPIDTTYYEANPTFDCFLTAVSAAIGITDAKAIWKSILAGASEQTVIAAVRLIAKRTMTCFAVVILIYQIGDCLDWW